MKTDKELKDDLRILSEIREIYPQDRELWHREYKIKKVLENRNKRRNVVKLKNRKKWLTENRLKEEVSAVADVAVNRKEVIMCHVVE